ncbi:SDR family oxidoreductase [Amycolatopsis sacchari]|uniref:SDR family oxidoreductase n=1 Tax=Amycolatopsis sacchari TaxID=115433 RepID=UPI000B87A9A6|nr:SDR family oxidoreductase [Amycolatopsis sacchari]
MSTDLAGKVALVAGGTRGASRAIAVELGRRGAFVYVTGRTSGQHRSEVGRPETIEGTLERIEEAGGTGTAIRVDHLEPGQVGALAERVDREHGRLDILVDGLWGGDEYIGWGKRVWEMPVEHVLRSIRLGVDAHLITSHFLFPLVIRQPGGLVVEMTDGTEEYNARYREGTSIGFYVAKAASHSIVKAQAHDLAEYGGTAVAMTPGWLRSEAMLDAYGVTEENWRDALVKVPHFCISESPLFVARAVASLAADPDRARFSGQTLSSAQLAKVYGFTDADGSRPDAWRYLDEVQGPGKPADATGYR